MELRKEATYPFFRDVSRMWNPKSASSQSAAVELMPQFVTAYRNEASQAPSWQGLRPRPPVASLRWSYSCSTSRRPTDHNTAGADDCDAE